MNAQIPGELPGSVDHASPAVSLRDRPADHRLIDHPLSDHPLSDHRRSDHPLSDHPLSDRRTVDPRLVDYRQLTTEADGYAPAKGRAGVTLAQEHVLRLSADLPDRRILTVPPLSDEPTLPLEIPTVRPSARNAASHNGAPYNGATHIGTAHNGTPRYGAPRQGLSRFEVEPVPIVLPAPAVAPQAVVITVHLVPPDPDPFAAGEPAYGRSVRRRLNGASIAALIVALVCPPAGLALAKTARRECREDGRRGAGIALAAHVIAALGSAALVAFLVFLALAVRP